MRQPKFMDKLIGPPLEAAAPPPATPRAARSTGPLATRHGAPGQWARPAFGTIWGTGGDRLEPFTFPVDGVPWDRDAAMSIPTVSRARDLICSAVAALPLRHWSRIAGTAPVEVDELPPLPWMDRPDPARTRSWMLSWTVDDLMFYGVAYWRIVERFADTGYPAAFQRMPAPEVSVIDDGATVKWLDTSYRAADVVEFLALGDGVLYVGARAVRTALRLDQAADRFAGTELPAGWLQQVAGDPMGSQDLADLAAGFQTARETNTVGALNQSVQWHESSIDPNKLQLTTARQYQSLELARLTNVPPYLVGAPTGTGMTYQNAVQARGDLIDFGAMPYITAIEDTLSGPNVLPQGRFVLLDVEAWTRTAAAVEQTTAPDEPAPPAPSEDLL